MKNICRYVFWNLFVILVLSPGSSDAGFLVELHNGRRLTVEGYRIDGKSYELYLQSGSLRVPAEEIKSIQEKKDDVARLLKAETEKSELKAPVDPGEQKLSKPSVPQGAEIESYIQRKAELREKVEEG